MRFSVPAVAVFVVLGISSTFPSSVEAGKVVIKASKDSSLYYEERGTCSVEPSTEYCTDRRCPYCNHGKEKNLVVEQYEIGSSAIVGFTLKKVNVKDIKSCKVIFAKPLGDRAPPTAPPSANVQLTDVGFFWREKLITYNNRPNPTAVGVYGSYDPWSGKPVDVTAGCKYALKNRKASGNGLAILLEMNNTRIAQPNYIIVFPSREAKRPAVLTIKYK